MTNQPTKVDKAIQLLEKSYSPNIVTAYLAECDIFDLFNEMTEEEMFEYRARAANYPQ